jgi:hypothetical protein
VEKLTDALEWREFPLDMVGDKFSLRDKSQNGFTQQQSRRIVNGQQLHSLLRSWLLGLLL